jgi:uncharacterized protein YecE (DUF72 family)
VGSRRPRVRIGTQGWSYSHWAGRFYPSGARSGDWLGLYARAFDIVEVDSTFYGAPPPERFRDWAERTPDGFTFTLKMPGEVTHQVRLRDDRLALRFCEDARGLGAKLGTILIQLPPDFGPDQDDAVAAFLPRLPADLSFAIEFRDRGWFQPAVLDLLDRSGVALAVSVGPWLGEAEARAMTERAPGRLLYLRWLGTPRRQADHGAVADRRHDELAAWARRIQDLDVDEVYAFFNNDYQGHSPASARRLQTLLGQDPVQPERLTPQTELFS